MLTDTFWKALQGIKTREEMDEAWTALRDRDRVIRQRAALKNAERLHPGALVAFGKENGRGRRSQKVGKLTRINRTTATVEVPHTFPWDKYGVRMVSWRVGMDGLRLATVSQIGQYRTDVETVRKDKGKSLGANLARRRHALQETPPDRA